jgi:hypothetical protein
VDIAISCRERLIEMLECEDREFAEVLLQVLSQFIYADYPRKDGKSLSISILRRPMRCGWEWSHDRTSAVQDVKPWTSVVESDEACAT